MEIMEEKQKIGFIGLGNMGKPMVKNLIKAGYQVTVYNRNAEKATLLSQETGVKVALTPSALLPDADIVISMLTDDAAVTSVYTGNDGIFAVKQEKALIVIDMSTVAPDTSRKLAVLAKEANIAYLDAPVSGSVKPATDGQLVIMAGGEQIAFDKIKPILEVMGKSATLLGDHGSGNVAKLAINLFLGITIQGLSEAVVFASENGIAADALLPLINESAVGSGITKIKSTNIINRDFSPAFALKLLRKDIRLAESMGLGTPAGKTLADTLQAAVDSGLGEEDMVAIFKQVEQGRN
jgi:3-hydroxyisobutyrate dehydrogenase